MKYQGVLSASGALLIAFASMTSALPAPVVGVETIPVHQHQHNHENGVQHQHHHEAGPPKDKSEKRDPEAVAEPFFAKAAAAAASSSSSSSGPTGSEGTAKREAAPEPEPFFGMHKATNGGVTWDPHHKKAKAAAAAASSSSSSGSTGSEGTAKREAAPEPEPFFGMHKATNGDVTWDPHHKKAKAAAAAASSSSSSSGSTGNE